MKLLDFGLAKALPEPSAEDGSILTTETVSLTQAGTVLGTAAYMSPEQAQGRYVDKRADIWAFGVVLYELLTGKRPFQGSTRAETLTMVVNQEPDWDRVPTQARRLLRRCLVKDPARRLRDIGDAMELVGGEASGDVALRHRRGLAWLLASANALLLVALTVAGYRLWSRAPEAETWSGSTLGGPEIALDPRISPDGHLLAFQVMEQGQAQIAVMTPESGIWSILTHTRELGAPVEIAWSRDGASLYYGRGADVPRGIYSVPVLGGEEKLVLENAQVPEVLPDGTLLIYRLNAQRNLQLFRYWRETGRLQELPVICRATIAADAVHISASPDGKEAVVFGTPAGREQEPDRLLAVDVNTGASRPLMPAGVKLSFNATAATRDGKSVVVAVLEDGLTHVVSIPMKGKFAPRTLFTTTSRINYLDTDSDGHVYASTEGYTEEVVRFPPDSNGAEVVASLSQPRGVIVSLPDERAIVSMPGLGRHRLMALASGKNPVPLVVTTEETSPPMTAAGPRGIAFMIGPPPHTIIGVAETATGRITSRIAPGKGEISAIASSPDGRTLYFSAGGKIWSVPSAGGEPVLIRAGDSVTADPGGRSLVISTIESAKIRLFRVPLDGGNEHEIITDGSVPLAPLAANPGALSADGRMLALLAPLDTWFFAAGILDTKTGHLKRIRTEQMSNATSLSWTRDGRIVGLRSRLFCALWRFQRVGRKSLDTLRR